MRLEIVLQYAGYTIIRNHTFLIMQAYTIICYYTIIIPLHKFPPYTIIHYYTVIWHQRVIYVDHHQVVFVRIALEVVNHKSNVL